MSSATHSVLHTSENLHKTKDKYDKYSDKIRRSKDLVDEIQKAEKWDEMKLQYSFKFFLFTITYLFLKRFFLWEIIYAIYYLVCIGVTFVLDFVLMPFVATYAKDIADIEVV